MFRGSALLFVENYISPYEYLRHGFQFESVPLFSAETIRNYYGARHGNIPVHLSCFEMGMYVFVSLLSARFVCFVLNLCFRVEFRIESVFSFGSQNRRQIYLIYHGVGIC